MPEMPDATGLRPLLAALTEVDRKVVGGLAILLAAEPQRVRDQEWLAEQFVALAVLAHGPSDLAGVAPGATSAATSDDVERIQGYARVRMPQLVGLALRVFVTTAEVLRQRQAPFTMADVQAIVLDLLGPD